MNVTLGALIGSCVEGNPQIVVVPSERVEKGIPMEVIGIKTAKNKVDGSAVIVLTI